ncbi:cupin domain-containing protein [Geodermatophilus sp. SYSU D00779]
MTAVVTVLPCRTGPAVHATHGTTRPIPAGRGDHRARVPRGRPTCATEPGDCGRARCARSPPAPPAVRAESCGSSAARCRTRGRRAPTAGLPGPPRHRHRTRTESTTVQEGRLQVVVGRGTRVLSAGETVAVPPTVTHGFSDPFDEPARIRMRETSAGPLEERFRALAGSGRIPPIGVLATINVRHRLSFRRPRGPGPGAGTAVATVGAGPPSPPPAVVAGSTVRVSSERSPRRRAGMSADPSGSLP